jgi:hypothetical protein
LASKSNDAVLAAEGMFALNTVTHHSSYKTLDCTSVLFKRIFPDSAIACKFSSAWTKTEAIIFSVMAPSAMENVMQLLKNNSVLVWSCHRHKQSQSCEGVSCCNPVFCLENTVN